MLQLRIAIELNSLRQSFRRGLESAARLGAEAVEIDGDYHILPHELTRTAARHVRKVLDDLNLRINSVKFQTRRGYNVFERLTERVEATKRVMTMAYDLGAAFVVNQIGEIPEQDDHPLMDLLVETLTDIGRHGQRIGSMLAAKTGAEDGASMRRLLDRLPQGSLVVDFDPGELTINRFSASTAIEQLSSFVGLVHARDGVQDLAQGRGVEVPLGRGSVDFPHLFGELEHQQFRGCFTLERRSGDDPIADLGTGVEFLRNLMS